nr:hypothetical protein BaRGS_033479 [Batillaria attramentaria]
MDAILNVTTTSKLPSHNSTNHSVDKATAVINTFMPWLLIVFGCICNVFIVLGMRTKNFRSLSTSVYMIVGAVNDLFALPIALVAHWLHVNHPESIHRGSGADFMCKFFQFYGWGQADVGIVVTTAMTADRAYVIMRPMTTKDLVKRAKIVIAVAISVVVVKDFHFWFSSGVVDVERKERLCDVFPPTEGYAEFYRYAWPWIHAMFLATCFVVMVTSNSIIIHHVRTNRQGQEITTNDNSNYDNNASGSNDDLGNTQASDQRLHRTGSTMTIHHPNSRKVTKQVTRMLLAESFTLILLTFPFSVHLIVTSGVDDLHSDPEKSQLDALVFSIVFYLLYANKCVNFLVYCMAGQRFRKAIVDEVLNVKRCRASRLNTGTGSLSSLRAERQRQAVEQNPG